MPAYRKQKVEERENLFDAETIFRDAQTQMTPEMLGYLRGMRAEATNGYAFAIERQSMGVLAHGQLDHTGHIARVQQILRLADRHQLYLPKPLPRANRQAGESPFLFDSRFWYVDGEIERASGFSVHPEVRPRFWMCYATLRRIRELDPSALPTAIVSADELRFMRADEWLRLWYRAIRSFDVDLIFPDDGRVDGTQLDLLAMKIRWQSEPFIQGRREAVRIAKEQGRIIWGRPPFGLLFENNGYAVVADPQEWPIVSEILQGLASGRFRTVIEASCWSRQTYGPERRISEALIHDWLKEGHFVEGVYPAYQYEWSPCLIQEKNGVLFDYSFTRNRNKRYVLEKRPESEWLKKEVEHRYGTQPIARVVLLDARARVHGQRGRPGTANRYQKNPWQIVPPRLMRCVCGYALRERAPIEHVGRNRRFTRTYWLITCECRQRRQKSNSLSNAEVRQLPDTQHTVSSRGSLSLALIPLLREKLFRDDLDLAPALAAVPADCDAERRRIETEQEALKHQLTNLAANLALFSPHTERDSVDAVRAQMKRVADAISERDQDLQMLATQTLQRHATDQELLKARERYRQQVVHQGDDPDFWRAVVEMFVKQIIVDLATRRFQVTCYLHHPSLQDFVGYLCTEAT